MPVFLRKCAAVCMAAVLSLVTVGCLDWEEDIPPEETGFPWGGWVLIAAGAAAVVIVVVLKKKKKKRAQELEEDMDDDDIL